MNERDILRECILVRQNVSLAISSVLNAYPEIKTIGMSVEHEKEYDYMIEVLQNFELITLSYFERYRQDLYRKDKVTHQELNHLLYDVRYVDIETIILMCENIIWKDPNCMFDITGFLEMSKAEFRTWEGMTEEAMSQLLRFQKSLEEAVDLAWDKDEEDHSK